MVTAEDTVEEMKGLSRRMMLPGEKLKQLFPRIARKTGITVRAAKAYWDGEYKTVDTHIFFRYLKAVEDHEREFQRHLEANRALRSRVYQLIHGSSDPDFYSQRAAEAFGPGSDVGGVASAEGEQ